MAASPQAVRSLPDLGILELATSKATLHVPVIDSATRIPALDGLRGVAILLVLLCHAVFEMQPSSKILTHLVAVGRLAWSGVDLFFVLSGFLIGGILLDSRDSPRYFKTFYLRRAYRILPLYGVAVSLFLIRYIPFDWMPGWLGKFSSTPIPWFSYLTFTQNIWMAGAGTFGVGAMAATWSLAVEEQFYLTVPFLVRKVSRSHLIFVLSSVVVAAPVLRTILHLTFKYGNFANYVLMPCRADALSLGVLAALMVRTPRSWNWLHTRRSVLYGVSSFLFIGLALLTYAGYDATAGPMVIIGYSWLALFYTFCLLIAVTESRGPVHRVLTSRGLTQLGVLAYCTYLLHLPLMEASRRVLGIHFVYASEATQFVGGLIGIALTLVIAKISWAFFEKPLLRQGQAYKY
jgi:peptidoglycan/LPS O-acetylase OafA/YrhL